jgi:hypothetical protein
VHLDWGASRFLTKQLQIGVVGYLYNQASCDGGSGDLVGCFQSRVAGAGAQLGYTVPIGALEANVNVKAYKEFASANRPEGWNLWLTYTLSPSEPAPTRSTASTQRMDGANPVQCTPQTCCSHKHGPSCGHEAVPHGDHVDYLVGGRLHHPHGDHCDDHGPVQLA